MLTITLPENSTATRRINSIAAAVKIAPAALAQGILLHVVTLAGDCEPDANGVGSLAALRAQAIGNAAIAHEASELADAAACDAALREAEQSQQCAAADAPAHDELPADLFGE